MSKVSYSAVVLDDKSRSQLIERVNHIVPSDWKIISHHMTINMGEINPEYEKYLGMKVPLRVKTIGVSDMAIAVGVEGFYSSNKIPHITIAVNTKEGGKPVMSNNITNWQPIQIAIDLEGIVTEIKY